jgi:dolichyl-phosphate-mannose--protein O-mannosyl transferase
MHTPITQDKDPADWCAVIAVLFLALVWHRLGIPTRIYFDEVHYVSAARAMLAGLSANPEHPLLGKEMIAASIALLGDKPLYWRIPSALFGAFGLFAFARAMWFASGRWFATIAAMLLLATNFVWFIQSRIAMLDMVMAGLAMAALWMLAAAVRRPDQGRWRLVLAGVFLGLSLGAKWSIAPVMVLPGLTFLLLKLKHNGRHLLTARAGGPVPGITLIEAGLWLGLVPLTAYWLTYWPGFFYIKAAINPFDPIGHHHYMLQLQDSVKRLHPYRSVWYQWIVNWRAVWYLYEVVDGAQRGIVLIGNPFTMLVGLPALLWCIWAGLWRRRYDALACAMLYLVSLGMWAVSGKPIQFYYHYLLPGTFLMACLALALDALWSRGKRRLPIGVLAVSVGMFLYFYPIISAAKLHHGKQSFAAWMWLNSWR